MAREAELIAKARSVGVEMNALSDYWLPDSSEPVDNRAGLVLGFAAVPEATIADALNRLSQGLVGVVGRHAYNRLFGYLSSRDL